MRSFVPDTVPQAVIDTVSSIVNDQLESVTPAKFNTKATHLPEASNDSHISSNKKTSMKHTFQFPKNLDLLRCKSLASLQSLTLVPPNFSHEGDFNRSSSFYQVDSRTSGTMVSPNTELFDDPQVLDQLVSTSYQSSSQISHAPFKVLSSRIMETSSNSDFSIINSVIDFLILPFLSFPFDTTTIKVVLDSSGQSFTSIHCFVQLCLLSRLRYFKFLTCHNVNKAIYFLNNC
ncbi:hypothetical protein RCL1_003491 [Eukaryota sp. TZLM3-RCL]